MRNPLYSAVILASISTICSAQTLTQTFGSGANAFSMDFVTIGNPNNAPDTTGYGSVAYTYNLGKYEVSRDMIDKANAAGSLGITLQDMTSYGGNGINKPATGINWAEAAFYVNWLNTSTGGTAAYKFDNNKYFQLWSPTDAGYNANNMFRNSLARYVIPSMDEWYKGAYGNASKLVLGGFSWNSYPTGNGDVPVAVSEGTSDGTAVYNLQAGPADITNAGGLSAYGTMGQGGNVWEWNETAYDGINNTPSEDRQRLGGSWLRSGSSHLNASNMTPGSDPWAEYDIRIGFRVAMVPEPSSLSLLALGGVAVALRRRQKRA